MAVWRHKIVYSMLGIAAVVLPAEQWAGARPILRAVGDFGSCRENDTPDGIDDLLWHDEETSIVVIQYLNADGVSVRNMPGSVANIRILNRGDAYYSSDDLVIGEDGTGGQGFEGELNIIGPIDDVIINDPGRDYGRGALPDLFDTDPTISGGIGFNGFCTTATGGLPDEVSSSGRVAKVRVTKAGSGYATDGGGGIPIVLVATSPSGDPADNFAALITPEADGTLPVGAEASIIENGAGFISTPAVLALSGTSDVAAELQAVLYGGIDDTFILDNGDSYVADPIFRIGDGTVGSSAVLSTSRGPGEVASVKVIHPGANYGARPQITIDRDVAAEARLHASIQSTGPNSLVQAKARGTSVRISKGWRPTIGDFDGDGDNDIFWHNPRLHSAALWFMEAGRIVDKNVLEVGKIARAWRVVDVGDFNLDGVDDIYWFNKNNRHIALWYINYVPGSSDQWIGAASGCLKGEVNGKNWSPVAVGDVSVASDGPEILWSNKDTGEVMFRMRSATNPDIVRSSVDVVTPGGTAIAAGEGWSARQLGDFDANGIAGDILMQNFDTGEVEIWLMNYQVALNRLACVFNGSAAITDWTPVGIGLCTGSDTVEYSNMYWREKGYPWSVMGWQMDRTTLFGATPPSAEDVYDSNAYLQDGILASPSSIYRVVDFQLSGLVSDIPMPPNPFEDSSASESADSSSDSSGDSSTDGDAGFNIDDFDINDPSTWP